MRILPVLVICLISLITKGGNPSLEKAKADFKKVNALYSATPVYSLDIQYCVYDSHTTGNLVEQKFGQYYKSKGQSYTKILDIETIVNSKSTIIVNNDDQMLVITDTKKIELSPIQTNMDTLLKLCDDIKIKEIGAKERYYSLDFASSESSEFSRIDIYINLVDYSIRKIVMFYNESMPLNQNDFYAEEKKPRLEVTYKTFKVMSSIPESRFLESSYVSLVDQVYKGKGRYSNYKIINQLQSARFKKK